ncbi:hypothetical protein [Hydrogenimonas sp. SS33]|uniref:hypothetical protein n=1 Tax=Hydrogenimonas leucolamina TaxID=2954236 RepID=UPI00336C2FC1
MRKMTVKAYAKEHRIPIFQVIKMIQRGELEGVSEEVNGVKVNYVLLSETEAKAPEGEQRPESESTSLEDEVMRLRERVAKLEAIVADCCRKR